MGKSNALTDEQSSTTTGFCEPLYSFLCCVVAGKCDRPPALPTTSNANVWPVDCTNVNAGSVCRSTCMEGFTGGLTTVCLQTGTWSAVIGSCVHGDTFGTLQANYCEYVDTNSKITGFEIHTKFMPTTYHVAWC